MVATIDNGVLDYQPVSTLLVSTIIAAFTFLTALSIRDSVTQSISALTPGDISKKLLFTLFSTMLFLFITVLLAYLFQEKV